MRPGGEFRFKVEKGTAEKRWQVFNTFGSFMITVKLTWCLIAGCGFIVSGKRIRRGGMKCVYCQGEFVSLCSDFFSQPSWQQKSLAAKSTLSVHGL